MLIHNKFNLEIIILNIFLFEKILTDWQLLCWVTNF